MGKVVKSNGKKDQSGPREVTPTVHKDNVAKNLLNFKAPEYKGVSKNNKARDRAIARGKLAPKTKKERTYTDKELGIPKLNTALEPVGVKVKGKKGKKFVTDTTMQLILAEVQQQANDVHASKLEKARELETIREVRRKEIEEREQAQKDKLESKKKELKNKPKKAKSEPEAPKFEKKPSKPSKPAKKRVSFA